MEIIFEETIDIAINKARDIALKRNHGEYTPLHFLYALITMEDTISKRHLYYLRNKLETQLNRLESSSKGSILANSEMQKWVRFARGYVANEQRKVIRENDMLRFINKFFFNISINDESLNEVILPSYLENINQRLKDGVIKPVWIDDEQIISIMEVLQKQNIKNPLIVGEKGVGKTSLIVALAQKIERNETPFFFREKNIYRLNLKSFLIGLKGQVHFEEKMDLLVKFFKDDSSGILFIDNFETLPDAIANDPRMVSLNILKLALEKGEINCICAISLESYNRYIKDDNDFDKLFPVFINEPSQEKLQKIMDVRIKGLEHFHGINISSDTMNEALELTTKYTPNVKQPLNVINVLDSSFSKFKNSQLSTIGENDLKKHLKRLEENQEQYNSYNSNLMGEKNKVNFKPYKYEITIENIANTISERCHVPVKKILQKEQENIVQLSTEIKKNVFGQDEHIDKIADTLIASYSGLSDDSRPLGSFMLFGPSGCGKTETAKVLAEILFGGEQNLIRFDLSEYSESHSVSKLIGPPAGYVGYEEGGQLTNAVRNKPYSVVLFDEVEKAHKNFADIMLQLLDDGRLTDNKGITTSFKNTIIIMTSNSKNPEIDFKPEVLGRFDQKLNFNFLDPKVMKFLVKKELKLLNKRLKKQNLEVLISDNLSKQLEKMGYSEKFGARPLKTVFLEFVSKPLGKNILLGNLPKGIILADWDGKETSFVKK